MKSMLTHTLAFAIALSSALFLSGCYTVPETGRSALNFMPEGMLEQQAKAAFQGLVAESKISTNPAEIARVERVGRRVLQAANRTSPSLPPASSWEFVVFEDDDQVNAFAMPGGKVGVFTGLLELTKTDDELATVIAHEIAHVAARHGNERTSHSLVAALGGAVAQQTTKDMDPQKRKLILAAYGAGASVGVILPYSRLHESEADEIGLLYMARAGYDPRAALSFWKKLAAQSGQRPPELLSTHPAPESRIRDIESQMNKALLEYAKVTGKILY